MKDCVTCDLPEQDWDPFDPLYTSGAHQCPGCCRHDLTEQATRKHAEK